MNERKYARNMKLVLPNNAEGRFLLEKLKEYACDEWSIVARGRHSDRRSVLGNAYRPGRENDIPLDKAETLAIYFTPRNLIKYRY